MARVTRTVSHFDQWHARAMRSSGGIPRHLGRRASETARAAKSRLGRNPRRIDTGALRASIKRAKHPRVPGGWTVGSALVYAGYVYYGTSRMEPNPYLTDGLAQAFGKPVRPVRWRG